MEHDRDHVKKNMTLAERPRDIDVRHTNGTKSKLQKYI